MFKAHRLMNNPRVRAKTATPFRDNGFRNILHPFWLKSAVLAWSSHRHCKLYVAIKSCNPPSCDCSVLIILMETLRNKLSGAVHRRHLRRALYCIVLTSGMSVAAQISRYAGVIGGVATLSADAGSQGSSQGLSLSSYDPLNGGALDVFAGVHLHNYFSVQANYLWNRN